MRWFSFTLLFSIALCGPFARAASQDVDPPGALLERVAGVLARDFHDEEFRVRELPRLRARYLGRARALDSIEAEKRLVHEFLGHVPASHVALYSQSTFEALRRELAGDPHATFGFQLVEDDGRYFVDWVLESGAGARAGLRRGDEVLSVDGRPPADSPRLDWSSDDSALDDAPTHRLECEARDEVLFEIARRPGQQREVVVRAERDSGRAAMERSARVIESEGRRIGYVHLWFIHMAGQARYLERQLRTRFAACDALVVDMRGRGGSASEAMRIVELLDQRAGSWRKPLVLLVDRGTRSAKEVISYELQRRGSALIVGEKTPGAVIPATFARVGAGMVLMYPAFTLGRYTEAIEGVGVTPDVEVHYRLAYAAGRDSILRAGVFAARAWADEVLADAAIAR